MHIKTVNEIYEFTQNLGSAEDLVTGLLATCLGNSPEFMDNLLLQLGIPTIRRRVADDYYIDTGLEVSSRSHAWIKKETPSLLFRPDLIISKAPEWNDEVPKGEQLILVESKLWDKLRDKQADNYRLFKEVCKRSGIHNIFTVYISFDEIGSPLARHNFDHRITWNQLIVEARNVIERLDSHVEQLFLEEIVDLMELRLKPDKEDFYEDGELDCKVVIQKIKYRIASNSSKRPGPVNEIGRHYSNVKKINPPTEFLKQYDLNEKSPMSFFTVERGSDDIDIKCARSSGAKLVLWYEKADTQEAEREGPEVIALIDLEKPYWQKKWFDSLNKISQILEPD